MSERLRVLIVEDDEADAELTRLALERGGFALEWQRVDTADALRQALDAREWDAIISDFAMPSFDGLRAFSIFLERQLDIPFIFVSGALGEERAVEAMRAGARDYILKGHLGRLSVAMRRELRAAHARRQRTTAEENVKRQQRRLALAVEVSGVGIFESFVPPDERTYVAERCVSMLGHTLAELPEPELLFDWIAERVHADDRDAVMAACAAFASGATDALRVELRARKKDGQWLDLDVRARAEARDGDDRLVHIVGVVHDLTEQKRLETGLRQAQKMDAIGRLAGGVAHDFNNLLTAIFAFGSFVMEALGAEHAARSDMEEVMKAAQRATALTGQLLAFSRLKKTSPRVVEVNEVIANIERMVRRLLGADIDVMTRFSAQWNVKIDPAELEQVIVNLAVNARDAMPHGGKLTIETESTQVDDAISLVAGTEALAGDYVLIAVSDTGIGMDPLTMQRIFEPFFTTKAQGRGTGLGLSTCYGIVKQAGGFIWVYSEPGHGATFKVYLPRATEGELAVQHAPPTAALAGSETVLIAEDDEQVRQLAVRTLRRYGYTVIQAVDGHDAEQQSDKFPGKIDLLLTDIVMPRVGGPELAGRVTPKRPDMKVLFMSGYAPNAVVHRGDIAADAHMIAKPFTPEALAREVRVVLDKHAAVEVAVPA